MRHYFLILFVCNITLGQNRTNLFKKEEPILKTETTPKTDSKKVKNKNIVSKISGNLPVEYLIHSKPISIEESPIILPTNKSGIRFRQLLSGDLVTATLTESVFAFSESKSPVRAHVNSGPLKGSVLIGEASLEKNSKRIQIHFKKFRDPRNKDIYNLEADAMDDHGVLGLVGEYVSNESIFFSAELLSAAAAGYTDSTIDRSTNILGQTTDIKNEDTFAKKGLTSALSKSADRFSEKLKSAPEYSILNGPKDIQILILDQPKLLEE
jgi:hypothetical protein